MGKNPALCVKTCFRGKKVCLILLVCFCIGMFSAPSYGQNEIQPTFWGEVYGSSEFNGEGDDNLVNEMFVKEGLHLFKIRDRDIDVYMKGKLVFDTEEYYWNNRWEIGAGTRIKPFSDFGLILFMEFIRNQYIDRDNPDEPNPDDSSYYEIEGGYAFWQWWGTYPWEVQGLNWYIPFSGWREVYSDGVFYGHDDDNVIFTVDYKEGLMLATLEPVRFDAYICLEAGVDANADEWNNYIAFGPGVRVAPFPKLDLKLSIEYLFGRYTQGEYNGTDEDISKLVVTLAFWHGW